MACFIDGVQYTETEYRTEIPKVQAHVSLIDGYVAKVQAGKIALEDVPAEHYSEVYNIINAPAPEEPEPTYTLDEAAALIAQEVASNG